MTSSQLPQDPNRLNWKQACAILGCSKAKFYRLIKRGEITAYKVGKRGLWVWRGDCEKLLTQQACVQE